MIADTPRMYGLRGATTVEEDTSEAITERTAELLGLMLERNRVEIPDIVSVILSATPDLRADFPAVAARSIGLSHTPLLCCQEIPVEGAVGRCVRVLMHVYLPGDGDVHHVYLHGARQLRLDLRSEVMRFIPALDDIVAYEPGQPIELVMRRFGLSDVVKLASNEFPQPPFPEVREAILGAIDELNRYPDGDSTDLRAALSGHYAVDPGQVAVGAGSCELLLLLGQVLLEKGDEVVFADPSFVVYNDVCLMHEATAVKVPLVDFAHDLDAMAAAVTPRTKMVIVCNPNNPTGTYVPVEGIARLVDAVPDDVLVVVDEAYNEFVTAADAQDALKLQAEHQNVIVLRTFSKIYGLCGLRVGYGLGPEELRRAFDKVRQPFNVNRLAQAAAIEALRHQDQVDLRREQNAGMRDYMVAALAERGRATVPSEANFMLVDTRDLCHPHDKVCGVLLSMGAIVRDGNALGCPGWARVSVGTQSEIDFFLQQLAALEVDAQQDVRGR